MPVTMILDPAQWETACSIVNSYPPTQISIRGGSFAPRELRENLPCALSAIFLVNLCLHMS